MRQAALRQVRGSFVMIPVLDTIPVALSSAGASGLAAMCGAHTTTQRHQTDSLANTWPLLCKTLCKRTSQTPAAFADVAYCWREKDQENEVYPGRHQECQVRIHTDPSERKLPLPSLARNASRGLPRPPSRVPSQEADQSARTPSSVAAWQGALPPIVARSSPLLTL